MGEPGGLPSMGSHRVGHDWNDLAAAATRWRRGWGTIGRNGKEIYPKIMDILKSLEGSFS